MEKKISIVIRLHSILEDIGLPWLAIGNLALYLYGIIDNFLDVKILVGEGYHETIHKVFSRNFTVIHEPHYGETKFYAYNVSSYIIGLNLDLHVFSGIVVKIDKHAISPSFTDILRHSKSIPLHGVKIPVPPLEWLYLYYYAHPTKEEIFNLIANKLKETGINFVLFEEFLQYLTEDDKTTILNSLLKHIRKNF